MKAIMFTGVPGVGKSALVTHIASVLNLPRGTYGDLMLEVMNLSNRDILQDLDRETRLEIRRRVDLLIADRFVHQGDKGGYFLLENHITFVNDQKIETSPVDAFWVYNLAGVCTILAPPEVVLYRRRVDQTRTRAIQPEDTIREHQSKNLAHSIRIAKHYRVPFIQLANEQEILPLANAIQWVHLIMERNSGSIDIL